MAALWFCVFNLSFIFLIKVLSYLVVERVVCLSNDKGNN